MLPFMFFVWNLVHQVHHKLLKNPENPSPPSPLHPLKKRKHPQIWLCPKSQGDAMGNPLTSAKRRGILDLEWWKAWWNHVLQKLPPQKHKSFWPLSGGEWFLSLMFFFFKLTFWDSWHVFVGDEEIKPRFGLLTGEKSLRLSFFGVKFAMLHTTRMNTSYLNVLMAGWK